MLRNYFNYNVKKRKSLALLKENENSYNKVCVLKPTKIAHQRINQRSNKTRVMVIEKNYVWLVL